MGAHMNVFRKVIVGAALSIAVATQANALNTRTWVSGKGVDQAGCGPVASPCRTLQYAHDNTAAGGEINVLDAAGYGSVAIGKAISIINDGAGVAGVLAPPGGNGVTVTAGADDDVFLRGLTIEGAGAGSRGIVFYGGRALSVAKCFIQSFTDSGIHLETSPNVLTPAAVRMADVSIEKTGSNGIHQKGGPLRVQVEGVTISRASFGILLDPSSGTTSVNITATHTSFGVIGIEFASAGGTVIGSVDSSSVHGSPGNIGFYVNATGTMYLSRSVSRGFNAGANGTGSGRIYSYGNNMLEDSGAGVIAVSMR